MCAANDTDDSVFCLIECTGPASNGEKGFSAAAIGVRLGVELQIDGEWHSDYQGG